MLNTYNQMQIVDFLHDRNTQSTYEYFRCLIYKSRVSYHGYALCNVPTPRATSYQLLK